MIGSEQGYFYVSQAGADHVFLHYYCEMRSLVLLQDLVLLSAAQRSKRSTLLTHIDII
jgi:hypothetical protein